MKSSCQIVHSNVISFSIADKLDVEHSKDFSASHLNGKYEWFSGIFKTMEAFCYQNSAMELNFSLYGMVFLTLNFFPISKRIIRSHINSYLISLLLYKIAFRTVFLVEIFEIDIFDKIQISNFIFLLIC